MDEGVAQGHPQIDSRERDEADEDRGRDEGELDVEQHAGDDCEQDEGEQVAERCRERSRPSARLASGRTHVAKLSGFQPQRRDSTTSAHIKLPTIDELTDAAIMPETSTSTHS